MVYFTWGEIYSLFPATCTDAFGAKYAATNAGLLYTAKGTAAIIGGPMAAALVAIAGSWEMVFWIAAAMDLVAAFMAILVLKPMRRRTPRPSQRGRRDTQAAEELSASAGCRVDDLRPRGQLPARANSSYVRQQRAGLAQLVEHVICNHGVAGSNPAAGTT